MYAPCSGRIARVSRYSSLVIDVAFRVRCYHHLCPDFPDRSAKRHRLVPTGLFRVRSPLLAESRLISFPPGTEMFQFSGLASRTYVFSSGYSASRVGFPIRTPSDQSLFASSPEDFVGCHVLRRLLPPRHSPCALIRLTI